MTSDLKNVAELWHPAMFWKPELTVLSAWPEHIPFAFWLTAMHRPRKFVELGTHSGASYFAFCQAIDRLGLSTAAYAIDTWKGDEQAGFYDDTIFQAVSEINSRKYTSFSTLVRATFDEAITYFADGNIDLLHIDGLHTYEAVKKDFDTWFPLLSDRAIVLFHDINVRRDNFGVFKVFEELTEKYPSFTFSHGHGLGVIAVGGNQNDSLRTFFDMAKDDECVRNIRLTFSRLGAQCSQSLHIKHLEDLYVGAHAEMRAKEAENARVTTLVEEGNTAREVLKNEIENVNAELEQKQKVVYEHLDALKASNQERTQLEGDLENKKYLLSQAELGLEAAIADRQKLQILFESLSQERDQLLTHKTVANKMNLASRVISRIRYGRPNKLFDAGWYLSTYDDVSMKGGDPWVHFVRYGASEGRWPNPMFVPHWYLQKYPQVQAANINPLVHYWKYGSKRGFDPHPSFSSDFYLSKYKDVAKAKMNPLQHYLNFGSKEGRATSPSEEGDKYPAVVSKRKARQISPAFHPISGLQHISEGGELFWKMDNNDPYFECKIQIKKGIYKFVISGAEKSSLLINLKLYYDVGNGFSEKGCINLGYVQPSEHIVSTIEFPRDVIALRLDPSERRGAFYFSDIHFEKVNRFSIEWLKVIYSKFARRREDGHSELDELKAYLKSMHKAAAELGPVSVDSLPPVWMSIIVPIYDPKTRYLDDILKSFDEQGIKGAELILVDDCSPSEETRSWLAQRQGTRSDLKIVFSENNGGISAATNTGISQASGEWLTLLDHDDVIAPHALQVIARAIKQHPSAKFFYTDEIHVNDELEIQDAMLKPAYDPILLSGVNYINHFSIYRRDRINEIGGLRLGFEGSQDYDLLLRYLHSLDDSEVLHIPYPAYWWRRAGETYSMKFLERATQNARKAIKEIYGEKGIVCELNEAISPNLHKIEFHNLKQSKVSIIIPNKNSYNLMKKILSGLFEKTDYNDFEVIVVDNGSEDRDVLDLYREHERKYTNFKVELNVEAFNFARSINRGMKLAKGDLFLMLNNDIEVISKEWLSEMVQCVNYQGVGIVGAKLLYPDNLIQHAGVVMGLGGLAGHWYLRRDNEFGGPLNRLHVRSSMVCVTGAAMLVTRQCAESLGEWDEENFAVAFNDVDYCARAYNNGFRVVWTPFACLYHHESVSRGSDEAAENLSRFQKECGNLRRIHAADRFLDPAINPAYSLDSSYPRVVEMDEIPDARHWFPTREKESLEASLL